MDMPDWVRRINYFGHSMGGAHHLINLDPEELISIAKNTTGLDDFGNGEWKDYCYNRINDIKKAPTLQRLYYKTKLLIGLRNRLFITDKIKQQPAVLNESINQPLIITGLHRTGTSILFSLLSLDSSYRSPLGFEAICPVVPPSSSVTDNIERKQIGQAMFDFVMDMYPMSRRVHDHRHDYPVECATIMDFVMSEVAPLLDAGDYETSLAKINSSNNYYWHHRVLQLLQYNCLKKFWLLKCPTHIHYMEHVFGYYPDARIIHTHRDPVDAISSSASIMKNFSEFYQDKFSLEKALKWLLSRSEAGLRKTINERHNGFIPESQITDVHFRDLMSDPVSTIRAAYEKLGLEFRKDLGREILRYLAENPRHKHGKHTHKAEDFGAIIEETREKLRFYTDYYNITLES